MLPGHRVADLADVLVLRRDDDAVVVGAGGAGVAVGAGVGAGVGVPDGAAVVGRKEGSGVGDSVRLR